MQPNDAASCIPVPLTLHRIFHSFLEATAFNLIAASWLQSTHDRMKHFSYIFLFLFFSNRLWLKYVFGKKWPVIGHTQQSSIFLSFFFFSRKEKKKKKKRGDACFVCCHYTHHTLTHCLTERTIKRKTCYEWTIKRKKYFLLYFYFK